MITNRDDYMKFRLGTFSKEGDEPEKKEGEEKETQTETPAEGGEEKKPEAEEKSGEASQEGELETHSVMGVLWSSIYTALMFKLRKAVPDDFKGTFTFLGVLGILIAMLHTIATAINIRYRMKYGKQQDMVEELNDIRSWIADVKSGKVMLTEGDKQMLVDRLDEFGKIVNDWVDTHATEPGVLEAVKDNLKITQIAAKELGIETGVQTYSKMKVYSKVDTIKAALYLDELGWEKVTPNGYLVPGTDQMIKIWTDENTDDTMTEVDGADGKVIGVQQSFEDFKDFVDRLIRNGVGSYSDEDEQTGAIEIAESRDEQGYSEDEIADKAEELEKEVEELKKDVAELKGEEPKSEEAKPEGETATNSEGICPECGKDPCECVKPEGELETKSDFATRLMEKLNRG